MAKVLKGLDPIEFQHPMDRRKLNLIKRVPGIAKVVNWALEQSRKRLELDVISNGFCVTPASYPHLHALYTKVCAVFDLDPSRRPGLYIVPDSEPNAYAIGSEDCATICMTRAMVERATGAQVAYVLGHELGHCLCGHMTYHTVVRVFQHALRVGGTFALPAWVGDMALTPLLKSWSRYSELSADRAGLLAVQSFDAACSSLLLLGGMPMNVQGETTPEALLDDQVGVYMERLDRIGGAGHFFRELSYSLRATHPRIIERFAALRDWRDAGEFDELVSLMPEDHRALAETIRRGGDVKYALVGGLIAETAAYLDGCGLMERKKSLPLIRRAYRFNESQLESGLSCLLRTELAVTARESRTKVGYALILFVKHADEGSEKCRKVTIEIPFDDAWDALDEDIRERLVRTGSDETTILIYQA